MTRLALAALVLFTSSSAAASSMTYCYFDADGDGYAGAGAFKWLYTHPYDMKQTTDACPSGWVPVTGDCDDTDAGVHPRRSETAFDEIDNNCNGRIDEPTFYWPQSSGWMHDDDELGVYVHINDNDTMAALQSGDRVQLYLEYGRAAGSARSLNETVEITNRQGRWFFIAVDGLSAGTAYRFRARPRLIENGNWATISDDEGDWRQSEDFYGFTTDASDALGTERHATIIQALYEYSQSETGRVGYAGTSDVDGSRYEASTGANWCSEFYSWLLMEATGNFGYHTTIPSIVDAFQARGLFWEGVHTANIAMPGDYMFFDSSRTGSEVAGHSAMILDVDGNRIATVEGNVGNKVEVMIRMGDDERVTGGGLGVLEPGLFSL